MLEVLVSLYGEGGGAGDGEGGCRPGSVGMGPSGCDEGLDGLEGAGRPRRRRRLRTVGRLG